MYLDSSLRRTVLELSSRIDNLVGLYLNVRPHELLPSACGTLNSFFDRHGAVRIAPTLRVMRGFVDIHSHMVPSGDDGVRSVDEAVELVLEAGLRGTAVQYATPHAMDRHPFTDERRRRVTAAR